MNPTIRPTKETGSSRKVVVTVLVLGRPGFVRIIQNPFLNQRFHGSGSLSCGLGLIVFH